MNGGETYKNAMKGESSVYGVRKELDSDRWKPGRQYRNFGLIVNVPIAEPIRSTSINSTLNLCQRHAGNGMVDVIIILLEMKCCNNCGAKVILCKKRLCRFEIRRVAEIFVWVQ